MSKRKNAAQNTAATETPVVVMTTETTVAPAAEVLGRPIDPNSARQKRIAELAAKKADPNFKLGRPSNPNSKHAIAKAEHAAKLADPNYKPMKGRPIDPTSPRQIALAAKAAKKATNGNVSAVIEGAAVETVKTEETVTA